MNGRLSAKPLFAALLCYSVFHSCEDRRQDRNRLRWTYAKRMDGGPKKKEELDAILLWEGKLDQLLTTKQVGFHFLSRIGRGEVLSSFYVSDAQKLRDLSVEAGAVLDTGQITYTVGDDPTWSEWKKNG